MASEEKHATMTVEVTRAFMLKVIGSRKKMKGTGNVTKTAEV